MGKLILDKYEKWKAECEQRFLQLKANEDELNRIFIDIYGLQAVSYTHLDVYKRQRQML